jgi:hypothetical protein
MKSHSKFIKFIEVANGIVNKLPRYNSKFSNRIFDNHQKIILLVIKQKFRLTYRGLIDFLYISNELCGMIKLKRMPHHTTLVKFVRKINPSLLSKLISEKEAEIIAVDASGFQTNNMSYYYANAWNSQDKRKHRRYLKLSIAIDTNKQSVLSYKIRLGPRNDNIDFKSVLKNLSAKFVVADRGYDSRANRYFVLRKLKAYPHIRKRITSGTTYEKAGIKLEFDEDIYHQRSKAETVFSVIKRKYGSIVLSKKFDTQKKELICRLIAYNLDREIILSALLFRGIQQSRVLLSQVHNLTNNSAG